MEKEIIKKMEKKMTKERLWQKVVHEDFPMAGKLRLWWEK